MFFMGWIFAWNDLENRPIWNNISIHGMFLWFQVQVGYLIGNDRNRRFHAAVGKSWLVAKDSWKSPWFCDFLGVNTSWQVVETWGYIHPWRLTAGTWEYFTPGISENHLHQSIIFIHFQVQAVNLPGVYANLSGRAAERCRWPPTFAGKDPGATGFLWSSFMAVAQSYTWKLKQVAPWLPNTLWGGIQTQKPHPKDLLSRYLED